MSVIEGGWEMVRPAVLVAAQDRLSDPVRADVVRVLNELYHRHGRMSVIFACDQSQTLLGVKSPYHATYVGELKRSVPSSARSWSPEDRAWFVHPSYFNTILELCRLYFRVGQIVFHSNCVGLDALLPTNRASITQEQKPEELTKSIVTSITKQLDDMDDKELVKVIIQAYKNKQVTGDEAIEMIDKLYD